MFVCRERAEEDCIGSDDEPSTGELPVVHYHQSISSHPLPLFLLALHPLYLSPSSDLVRQSALNSPLSHSFDPRKPGYHTQNTNCTSHATNPPLHLRFLQNHAPEFVPRSATGVVGALVRLRGNVGPSPLPRYPEFAHL